MVKILAATIGFTTLFLSSGPLLHAGPRAISPEQALRYFQEADTIARADGGRLWGVSLGGPLLLVDPETRLAYANQPDTQGRLTRAGQVLRGQISTDINLANTATDWAGTNWAMLVLPLPEDERARARVIFHELWHRVQDQIGLPSAEAANHHLETREGRYWMQLEWRALGAALGSTDAARIRALTDAALFRQRRRALFAEAATQENALELHEGLAEYTGVKLSAPPDPARSVIAGQLEEAPQKETFVRSFAYATGPAYGLLLDETGTAWRERLDRKSDLGATLLQVMKISLPNDLATAAETRARAYGSAELLAREEEREAKRRKLTTEYRARLVDGPVLKIPLREMKMQFDPGNLFPLESSATVYPSIRIVDEWGILNVTSHGALMSSDFSQVVISRPETIGLTGAAGDGWDLELKPGWSVTTGARPGDFKLQPPPAP